MPEELPLTTQEQGAPSDINEAIAHSLDGLELEILEGAQALVAKPGVYLVHDLRREFGMAIDRPTLDGLNSGLSDLSLVSRYVGLYDRATNVREGHDPRHVSADRLYSLTDSIANLDKSVLRTAFNAEPADGTIHEFVLKNIWNLNEKKDNLGPSMTFLQKAYGLDRTINLLTVSDDPYKTEVRDLLLTQNGMSSLFIKEQRSEQLVGEEKSGKPAKEIARGLMRDIVLAATSIDDPELADSYVYAASRYGSSKLWPVLTLDIIHKIEALGPDKLATLREFAGIHALDSYSMDQLERMIRVADADPTELTHLGMHDVTALITNKMGDHNGILSRNPAMIDDDRKRTIFFEIQSVADMYRLSQKLESRGIQPSTLVFGAHGSNGEFSIMTKPPIESTKERAEVFTIHTPSAMKQWPPTEVISSDSQGHALSKVQRGFARLIEDYMAPSKGIDDDTQNIGGKKIVFIMCKAAKETNQVARNPTTETNETIGITSTIGQFGENLAKIGTSTKVEIYGADVSIQMEPTPRGLYYTANEPTGDEPRVTTEERQAHPAVQVNVFGNNVIQERIDEIPLRNFDKTE